MVCSLVALNYFMDFYGIFRDIEGRKLKIYENARTSKFLFSYRYIPNNFDGILIGSSISETLDVSKIGAAHVYNASIAGANISEEKLIADNVFARGHIKLVVFCIFPYLTATHGRKSGYMDPREYWGSLGSVGLNRVYVNFLKTHFAHVKDGWDENGVYFALGPDEVPQNLVVKRTGNDLDVEKNKVAFVDETAFAEYAQLIQTARKHGAKIVGFIPPIYSERYAANRTWYNAYFARMSALFRPDENIVNFNLPKYQAYTADLTNFYDGSHLSNKAVKFFSTELALAILPKTSMPNHGALTEKH
jgi:hypothetical protein